MIFESNTEKRAFEFICGLASELTDKRGCNDLEESDLKAFKDIVVWSEDEGKTFSRKALYDFDIIRWLDKRIKFMREDNGG